MKKSRLSNEDLTEANFKRLPLLLRAGEVRLWTGWTAAELAGEVRAIDGRVINARGRIEATTNKTQNYRRDAKGRKVACKQNYHKYTKLSLARVLGFAV